MTFVPGSIIIPRKHAKEKPRKIERKKEKRLVYVLIKVKENQFISEKAKEVEAVFRGRTFSRLTNVDEFSLLSHIKNMLSKHWRIYVVELDDGTSRWFYIVPSEERIRFERKDKLIVFLPKNEDALEEIVQRIVNKGVKQKSRVQKILEVFQGVLGIAGGFLVYRYREDILRISNVITMIFALILLIQGLKKGYKEREYEID
ncbi:hypothetical protein PAP_03550 [Palaeococcus pacificus DY20341]|uniref:Uncharacterized protein n=1 Tax=Palaeococcus pacificus DY20341 TaxID=1343739 RepID=A0A075LQZ1_9EURY|nr:hypothetical protein [Palaeococcus pacificus]AIF69130.1 hypothetical protein PAP_03550 [Palaeococcus pacificus DY20341]